MKTCAVIPKWQISHILFSSIPLFNKYNINGKLIKSIAKKWQLDFNYYPNIRKEDGIVYKELPEVFGAVGNITIFDNKYILAAIIDVRDKIQWIDIYDLNGNYISPFSFSFSDNTWPKGATYSFFNQEHFYYLIGVPGEWPRLILYSHNLKEMLKIEKD